MSTPQFIGVELSCSHPCYDLQFNHYNPYLEYCSHVLWQAPIIICGRSYKNSHKHQVGYGAWSANQLLQTAIRVSGVDSILTISLFCSVAIWCRGAYSKTSSLLWVCYLGKGGTKEMQYLSHQFISHYCVLLHFINQQVCFKYLKQMVGDALPNPCHAAALVLFWVQYEVSLKSVHCKTKFTTTLIWQAIFATLYAAAHSKMKFHSTWWMLDKGWDI